MIRNVTNSILNKYAPKDTLSELDNHGAIFWVTGSVFFGSWVEGESDFDFLSKFDSSVIQDFIRNGWQVVKNEAYDPSDLVLTKNNFHIQFTKIYDEKIILHKKLLELSASKRKELGNFLRSNKKASKIIWSTWVSLIQ